MIEGKKLSRKLEPVDERLKTLIDDLEQKSLDTLEAAARQITGLVTTLLGLFFGVLAFKDNPSYLAYVEIKIFGILALGGFMAALMLSLGVTLPQRSQFPRRDLTAMRETVDSLLQRKRSALRGAQFAFGAGVIAIELIILDLILRL